MSAPGGELAGRVAVVTGGGRGIGAAVALRFAEAGARLVVASRTRSELEEVARRCGDCGAVCHVSVSDVTDEREVAELIDGTVERFGGIDVLVNAAGVQGPVAPIEEADAQEWLRTLQVNLFGTLLTCRRVLPSMIRRRSGVILNLSGGGATAPQPLLGAYAASKAAVVRMTETLAQEVAGYGIRVNAIAPGAVDTHMQDAVLEAGPRAGELYERVRRLRQTGEGATPVEVPAELAVYLASDRSAGLTGRLVSAPHDPWREWTPRRIEALSGTPWYTLRRIDPYTLRGLDPHALAGVGSTVNGS